MDELQESDAQFPQPRSRGFVGKEILKSGVTISKLKARILVLEEENRLLKEELRRACAMQLLRFGFIETGMVDRSELPTDIDELHKIAGVKRNTEGDTKV